MQVKDKVAQIKTWLEKQPKIFKQGISSFLVVLLIFGVITVATANRACAVEVDGQVVAVVESKAVAEQVVNSLIKEQQQLGNNVKALQNIAYKEAQSEDGLVEAGKFKELLSEKITFEVTAAGIQVNGSLKVALKNKAEAEQVLQELKKSFKVGSEFKVDFQEQIAVVDVPVLSNKILPVDQAVKRLKGESDVPRYYTVKEGDTIWDIAASFKISPEELQDANPGFTPETMQIGQKIKMIGVPDPILNVVATADKTVKEEINYPQQVKKNPNLAFGKTKVVQKGEAGLKKVTYRIVAVNGLETERKVLTYEVIKKGKPQIIERSAQTMVASRGARPGGAILSPFGMRGGRMHTGVDLGMGYGAPVGAYNSGRVVRAGWFGAYGKCVDINHGNGIVTRYAHLSTINVNAGQSVERGQNIGRVGSTGRSTGPHLHFEVIVNGSPRNPMGYI